MNFITTEFDDLTPHLQDVIVETVARLNRTVHQYGELTIRCQIDDSDKLPALGIDNPIASSAIRRTKTAVFNKCKSAVGRDRYLFSHVE